MGLCMVLIVWHEASVHNIYDELLREGPTCRPHLALPGRGGIVVPVEFEVQGSGIDFISDNYRYWSYTGDKMDTLFAGELYESWGLWLTIRYSQDDNNIDIYIDSGSWKAPDGNGYCVEVNWIYSASTRTLKKEISFFREGTDHYWYSISGNEFVSDTGLTRQDIERWVDHVYDTLIVKGYLEANKGRTRFTQDNLGTLNVVDITDWDVPYGR